MHIADSGSSSSSDGESDDIKASPTNGAKVWFDTLIIKPKDFFWLALNFEC